VRRAIGRPGVMKAYCTRVGDGPFPSELNDAAADRLREGGSEFGATTGRPRRCGWFDVPAARYASQLCGIDGLAITKLDVLSGLRHIGIVVGYADGVPLTTSADTPRLERVKPVIDLFPAGRKASGARSTRSCRLPRLRGRSARGSACLGDPPGGRARVDHRAGGMKDVPRDKLPATWRSSWTATGAGRSATGWRAQAATRPARGPSAPSRPSARGWGWSG
jgi:hypothetical protein